MKIMKEYLAMLPEAERPEAEKALVAEVAAGNPLTGIDTKEKAAEWIQKNPLFKGAYDADISRIVAAHDEKFIAEKVPGLVASEVAKLNPPKTPVEIELADIKQKLAAKEVAETRATQKALVMTLATEKGVPAAIAELCIRDTEEATRAAFDATFKTAAEWRDKHAEALLKEKLGNNGKPPAGQPPADPKTLKEKYDAAVKAGNGDLALVIQTEMQALALKPAATVTQ
jgi:hypothetical protein